MEACIPIGRSHHVIASACFQDLTGRGVPRTTTKKDLLKTAREETESDRDGFKVSLQAGVNEQYRQNRWFFFFPERQIYS